MMRSLRILVALAAPLCLPLHAFAAPPEVVRIQGTITSIAGGPVADGQYELKAEIFTVSTAGSAIYTQTVDVMVVGGAYTLALEPLPPNAPGSLATALSDSPRFLQVTVESGPGPGGPPIGETLLPRQEIASVPFALGGVDSMPAGAIVLWDTPTGCSGAANACPCGYDEVAALRAKFPVGVDLGNTTSKFSNSLGADVGGPRQGGTEGHNHGTTGVGGSGTSVSSATSRDHLPPFQVVLFCRKQATP